MRYRKGPAPQVFEPDGGLWDALGLGDRSRLSWHDDALCAQTDPDAFFPEKGQSLAPAQQVCAACPVQAQCLADALEHGEQFGVWGGVSARKRQALRKAVA